MNEAETRAEHIDPALKAAGWGVVEGTRILREYHLTPGRIEGLGRQGKPLIADYILDFVLQHYVAVGVEELDQEKLTPLLRLKYKNSISDAVADLGQPETIARAFSTFQRYLYSPAPSQTG